MKRRNLWAILLSVAFLLMLAVPARMWTKANVGELARQHNSKLSPVIMIPGSSATQNRFDQLVSRLNEGDKTPHSLLKMTVHKDDRITTTGSLRPHDNEPIIVVGFEDNRDGYSNIKHQARWFSLAFKKLTDRYRFNNFKAIGHSNGGLIYTAFMENYFKDDNVKMTRFMSIGSPYNFEEARIDRKTEMLSDFINHRKQIPKTLTMFSVAGTENYDSDGIVPVQSVEAGKYVFQGQAKYFTEITVTGDTAQHSDLPQNPQIVQIIKQYMLR